MRTYLVNVAIGQCEALSILINIELRHTTHDEAEASCGRALNSTVCHTRQPTCRQVTGMPQ